MQRRSGVGVDYGVEELVGENDREHARLTRESPGRIDAANSPRVVADGSESSQSHPVDLARCTKEAAACLDLTARQKSLTALSRPTARPFSQPSIATHKMSTESEALGRGYPARRVGAR